MGVSNDRLDLSAVRPQRGSPPGKENDQMAKSAIVTGASGGIGRAVARRLSRDGFDVVVNYAGNAAKAEEVVAEIAAAGGRGIAVQADVASATDVERLFKEAADACGAVDVVVNCAGIMTLRPIAGADLDVFDKVIATNLRGAFLVMAQAARVLPQGGRIIAFSTSVIAKAFPTYGRFSAPRSGRPETTERRRDMLSTFVGAR
jgi:3-oxoacyl-[acyl-carrier protein] reductase